MNEYRGDSSLDVDSYSLIARPGAETAVRTGFTESDVFQVKLSGSVDI